MFLCSLKKSYYKILYKIFKNPEFQNKFSDLKTYLKERKNFKTTKYYEIEKIAQPERHLSSVFLYDQNKYYQNEFILKEYAGIDIFKNLNATIEHGVYLLKDYFYENDIKNNAKAIITFSKYRKEVLEKHTDKEIIPIGPYIHYAKSYLNEKQKRAEKLRLGRNLLVFPTHSTDWSSPEFNIRYFISEIEKLKKDFDSVRVCLYWKDIVDKKHLPYIEQGYECVCAGNIFSPFFLSRLKNIIELSDMTVSNSIGTHTGYSVFMNKPNYFIKTEIKYTFDKKLNTLDNNEQSIILKPFNSNNDYILELEELFSTFSENITTEQKEKIDRYWGTSLIKTPEELNKVLKKYLI